MVGRLDWVPAADRLDLLAAPVAAAVRGRPEALVAPIDPALADTAAFCAHYDVPLEVSANCVIVAAKGRGQVWHAACVVLAVDRADINGVVRRHLGARKVSFAPMEEAASLTGMEYGGITPLGLPAGWPILVDQAVAALPQAVVGAGRRAAKLLVPGKTLADLGDAEVIALAQR